MLPVKAVWWMCSEELCWVSLLLLLKTLTVYFSPNLLINFVLLHLMLNIVVHSCIFEILKLLFIWKSRKLKIYWNWEKKLIVSWLGVLLILWLRRYIWNMVYSLCYLQVHSIIFHLQHLPAFSLLGRTVIFIFWFIVSTLN